MSTAPLEHPGPPPASIFARVYLVLWVLGLLGAIGSFLELQRGQLLAPGDFVAAALGVAMLFQHYLVYRDLHIIEERPTDAAEDYPRWINRPFERFIRLCLLVFLLLAVGKVADVLTPLAENIRCVGIRKGVLGFLDPNLRGGSVADTHFVKGSLGVFFLLFTWNVFALGCRMLDLRGGYPAKGTRLRWWLVTVRVAGFVVISFCALVYWAAVFLRSSMRNDIAELLVFLYVLLLILTFALRSVRFRDRLESALSNLATAQGENGNQAPPTQG